mmetsp:Transcript_27207/g.77829  ORF Transcript_27207/g.77829 Transcript_27207/m.77829 type:complete len:272 (+) Transcript_27207:2398-3213(+)
MTPSKVPPRPHPWTLPTLCALCASPHVADCSLWVGKTARSAFCCPNRAYPKSWRCTAWPACAASPGRRAPTSWPRGARTIRSVSGTSSPARSPSRWPRQRIGSAPWPSVRMGNGWPPVASAGARSSWTLWTIATMRTSRPRMSAWAPPCSEQRRWAPSLEAETCQPAAKITLRLLIWRPAPLLPPALPKTPRCSRPSWAWICGRRRYRCRRRGPRCSWSMETRSWTSPSAPMAAACWPVARMPSSSYGTWPPAPGAWTRGWTPRSPPWPTA